LGKNIDFFVKPIAHLGKNIDFFVKPIAHLGNNIDFFVKPIAHLGNRIDLLVYRFGTCITLFVDKLMMWWLDDVMM